MIEMIDATKASVNELKTAANRLRSDYKKWKLKNPNQQNEEYINYFLLIRSALQEKNQILSHKDEILDIEAQALTKISVIPEIPGSYTFDDNLAPVGSSGDGNETVIKLEDIESDFKDFSVADPMIWIVGGVVTHLKEGTRNDIDVLVSIPTKEDLQRIILFRLYRMFSPEMRDRLHFLVEKKTGPFTNFLPLYRLKLERISDAEIMKMGEGLDLNAEIRLRTKGTEKQKKEAGQALKKDKITPGEFLLMTKPVRGYYPGKTQTLELFLNIYDEHYEYPSLSSKKFNGEHILIGKLKDDIIIHSEDGEFLEKLSNLKNEVKTLRPEICVLEAELENWDYLNKQYFPRETVHTSVDEDNYTANVFEILYYKGEIPDELFEEIELFDKDEKEWKKKYL